MMTRAREMHPLKVLATTLGVALLVWGLLFAYASSPAWAAIINVNSLADDEADDGECTLREAIIAANTDTASGTATGECAAGSGDDEIHFALPGTAPWTVNLTGVLPDLSTSIEIVGPGDDQLTVRRRTGGDYRILTVTGNTTVVTIKGMTISNGNVVDHTDGGGILIADSATLTVADCTITNNFSDNGGGGIGIADDTNGTLTVTGSTITGNTAESHDGGGIRNDGNGTVTVTDSTLSNNFTGHEGGALANESGGTMTVTGSTMGPENFSDSEGGGIYNGGGTMEITDSTIRGNSTNSIGGGIFNGGTLEVTDSTISGNISGPSSFGGKGGGIYSSNELPDTDPTNDPDDTTTITNSTISGNKAAGEPGGEPGIGGGVYNSFGLTVIENSTITKNTAPEGRGSGVASQGSDLFASAETEVLSSIISENTNTDVDFLTDFGGTPTNTFLSRGYNLIGDGNATGAFNQTGDQTGVADPGLGDLADNGGPTQTHALLTGSPAIDKGPPSTSCPPPPTDQRGVSRPQDGDADATPVCDIGSFELEPELLDTTAPKVISTFPLNGREVGPAANITATFSEDMRSASVLNAFKLFRKGSTTQIDAQVTYAAATDIATLNPINNLRSGATYKAVVTTQAKDKAGNRLDQDDTTAGLQPKVWFFEID